MKSFWHWLLIVTLLFIAIPSPQTEAQDSNGISDARFARLARGINLPFWFWYAPEPPEIIDTYFTADDFAHIESMGFTFVRIPFDFEFLYDADNPTLLNEENLGYFDRGLDKALAAGLAVIVDLHSTSLDDSDNAIYSGRLEDDPAFVNTFEQFWRSLASHLSARDPDYVFFELMNEPVFEDTPSAWLPIQERLVTAVREVAPFHTLIVSGALWSSRDTLVEMPLLADPNVVYNFHFYDPFLFTHQGATWTGWWVVEVLRGVPYPSSPEAVASVLKAYSEEEIRNEVAYYGDERWDAARIDAAIAPVAAWATQNNVRVICNEFGVLGDYAPPADRAQWIFDVRTTFEKYNIGWSMWEYDSIFGLARREKDRTWVEIDIVRALGLTLQ